MNEIVIPPIHILDLMSHYFLNVNRNKVLTPLLFCKVIRSSLTDEDIRLIRDKCHWNIEFAGEPHTVSPGAKRYEDIAPYFMKYYDTNNCYAFAMDDLRGERTEGSLPGTISRDPRRHRVNWQSCTIPKEMVLRDSASNHKHLEIMNSHNVGKMGTYRVQFFVDTNKRNSKVSTDFHWYREVRPPAWIAHYLKHHKTYERITKPVYVEQFMKEVDDILSTMPFPVPKTSSSDNDVAFHGMNSYYSKHMGMNEPTNGTLAIYANKAGLSKILTICGRHGRILCNPVQAVRGYNNRIDYDKFCEHFVVKSNRGKTTL